MKLTTEEQLAEEFATTVDKVRELRRKNKWPHVRLGRFDVRYTPQQVEQILALHSVKPGRKTETTTAAAAAGLTQRSARRTA